MDSKNQTQKREIKFRAWHVAEKLMCDIDVLTPAGAFLIGVKNAPDDYFNGGKSIIISPKNGRFCKHDDIDLMQFTGLHDKNGKEIYEGDIIKYSDSNWGYGGEYDKNNDGYLYANITFEDGCFGIFGGIELYNINAYCEVIGNIYEHDYLLNK